MNKKVLFVATVDKGHIIKFHIPYLKYFKEKGFEVHVACAGNAAIPYCDKKYELPFQRSPFRISNLKAYRELKNIIHKNNYSLIHCHTPVGGVIGRLASKNARKKGTKVLYTGHGFHFYKGAPMTNWLIYYPIEKWLSKYTDCLITINKEDYQNALNNKFQAESIKLVNGVGVDLGKFSPLAAAKKQDLRNEYGYSHSDFILTYIAELNYNKHQDLLINAIDLLKSRIPEIKLLLAGDGQYEEHYKDLVNELGVDQKIDFLGYRNDVNNLLKLSDIAVSTSRREGLPVNIMEAMATGLPIVVTDCRGNRDLVQNNINGYVVGMDDAKELADAIEQLYKSAELRAAFGQKNIELVKSYSIENIMKEMEAIYSC